MADREQSPREELLALVRDMSEGFEVCRNSPSLARVAGDTGLLLCRALAVLAGAVEQEGACAWALSILRGEDR